MERSVVISYQIIVPETSSEGSLELAEDVYIVFVATWSPIKNSGQCLLWEKAFYKVEIVQACHARAESS